MTFYEPIERTRHSRDGEGLIVYTKHMHEVDSYLWDLTDWLESGETVSSVTTDVSGVTLNSASLATPVVTLVVTGTDGSIRMTATTSAGRVKEQIFFFVAKPSGEIRNDYQWST